MPSPPPPPPSSARHLHNLLYTHTINKTFRAFIYFCCCVCCSGVAERACHGDLVILMLRNLPGICYCCKHIFIPGSGTAKAARVSKYFYTERTCIHRCGCCCCCCCCYLLLLSRTCIRHILENQSLVFACNLMVLLGMAGIKSAIVTRTTEGKR